MMDLQKIFSGKNKKLALLIDPDKTTAVSAAKLSVEAENNGFQIILIGGSLVSEPLDQYIQIVKKSCKLPLILFPGSLFQVSAKADGMLLLSLISGRNPEYLIGQHVLAAPVIKKMKMQTISTGYILIDGGNITSVEYMSNTKAIPSNKTDIIKATALAGEMLGLQLIYLEAGSGAKNRVPSKVISEVKNTVSVPVIVGGGISTAYELKEVYKAGSDIAVIGTAIENNAKLLKEFAKVLKGFNK
jgi:phosphoglycerol geranylgeranyltransferase